MVKIGKQRLDRAYKTLEDNYFSISRSESPKSYITVLGHDMSITISPSRYLEIAQINDEDEFMTMVKAEVFNAIMVIQEHITNKWVYGNKYTGHTFVEKYGGEHIVKLYIEDMNAVMSGDEVEFLIRRLGRNWCPHCGYKGEL